METSLAARGRAVRTASSIGAQLVARAARARVPLAALVAGSPAAGDVRGDGDRVAGAPARRGDRVGVRPSAVTLSAAPTPSCVWPPRIGRSSAWLPARSPLRARARRARRRGRRGRRARRRGRAHRGEVVRGDEHRAPAGPLRVVGDHRGEDRVGARDDVRAGHGDAVVAEPAVAPAAGPRAAAERRLRRLREPLEASDRPAHERCGVPATCTAPTCSQPSRRKNAPERSCTCASKRSAPRPCARRACRADERPADVAAPHAGVACCTTRRLPRHQPR